MKSIQAAYKAYLDADSFMGSAAASARTAGMRQKWSVKRLLNDQAYYVFIFAQLEGYINDRCEKLVGQKSGATRWRGRRLWDTVDLDRLDFKRRLALLTDKTGPIYAKIVQYYQYRNHLAHGEQYTAMPVAVPVVAVPVVASDLMNMSKSLRP